MEYKIRITQEANLLLLKNGGINPYSIISEYFNELIAGKQKQVRLNHTMDRIDVKYYAPQGEIVFYVSRDSHLSNGGEK